MKFLGLEISKKLVIGIIAGILVVGGVTTGVILLNNNDDSEKKQEEQTSITLKKDLNFEINSEVKLLSLVDGNSVEVTSDDEAIDTSILGEKEVTIKYLDKNKKEKEQVVKIKIVDTQAPTIEYQKELTTIAGTEIDLLNGVKVSDNSKEEIKATIEGTYDFKTEGEYKLKYIAVDSSNNKKEEEFTLKVNKKPTTNTGTTTKPSGNTGSNNNTSNNQGNDNQNKKHISSPIYVQRLFSSKTETANYFYSFGLHDGQAEVYQFKMVYNTIKKKMTVLTAFVGTGYSGKDPILGNDGNNYNTWQTMLETNYAGILPKPSKVYTDEEIAAIAAEKAGNNIYNYTDMNIDNTGWKYVIAIYPN